MTDNAPNSYDVVPYQGHAFAETHPERLATIGALFGMQPAPSDACRVLELGCAEGSNLIPMAVRQPAGQYVGVDSSKRQIEAGRTVVSTLGLANIDLLQQDILDLDDSLGQFDYIIAHGVYSWVAPAVRDKVLSICQENLNPQGIAFVSYSTLPGGHLRAMVREMMFYHARNDSDALTSVKKGRELLGFLIDSSPENSAYRACLEWERGNLSCVPDHQLRHDTLEDENEPVYFTEFVNHAERFELQYLGDAAFETMQMHDLSDEAREKIAELGSDRLELEQYADFVRNRSLRKTLLCHKDVRLDLGTDAMCLPKFRVASPLRIDEQTASANISDHTPVTFRLDEQNALTTDIPFTKTAFKLLEESWPQSLPFNALVAQTEQKLQSSPAGDDDKHSLAHALFECFGRNMVRFDLNPSSGIAHVAECPQASPIVRMQAAASDTVTSELHRVVEVDLMKRILLNKLDGQTTRDQLVALLCELAQRGEITIHEEGTALTDPDRLRESLGKHVDAYLAEFARSALLVA